MNSRDYKTAVDAVARTFADEDFKLGRHNFNDWALLIPSVFITKNAKADWTSSPGSSCGQNIKSECVIHWTYTSFFYDLRFGFVSRISSGNSIVSCHPAWFADEYHSVVQVKSSFLFMSTFSSKKRHFGKTRLWLFLTSADEKNCPVAIAFISLW